MLYALTSDLLKTQSKYKEKLQCSSIVDFNTLTVDGPFRQKINKEMLDFNSSL